MKKLTLIVSALALLIGFSQCKKEEITPNNNNEGVFITLTAGYGQQDAKTVFNPTNGSFSSFTWSNTKEYIYVGGSKSDGCIGTLTGTGNGESQTITFSGTITPADNETTLYFFYLGNGDHAGATTLDFSNQSSGTVTDWHIAIGRADYSGTDYNVTLNMAMAIARFNLSGFDSETVYLSGDNVYSTASINYNDGSISGNSKGYINVGTAGADKYVALIPSAETETTLHFNSSSKTGTKIFPNGIQAGKYYSNGNNALSVTASPGSGIPGTFSVSATKKVFFSKGNLQYQASTGTWRFAEHQYDYVGDATNGNVYVNEVKSNNANIASDYTGWIDLFGWGTSGWNNGNSNYQPYNHYYSSASYGYGYGPKNSWNYSLDLTGDYANADWGVYNNISNGGTGWRTLTSGDDSKEWNYLFNTRSASTINGVENARYARATVNGVNGVVLFPDNYTHPDGVSLPNNTTINSSTGWGINVYDGDNWIKIESAGAVFLPVTGKRNEVETTINDTDYGYYWSVNYYTKGTSYYACSMVLKNNVLETSNKAQFRYYGLAVRLVKDVE